jgi:hypothetical protein
VCIDRLGRLCRTDIGSDRSRSDRCYAIRRHTTRYSCSHGRSIAGEPIPSHSRDRHKHCMRIVLSRLLTNAMQIDQRQHQAPCEETVAARNGALHVALDHQMTASPLRTVPSRCLAMSAGTSRVSKDPSQVDPRQWGLVVERQGEHFKTLLLTVGCCRARSSVLKVSLRFSSSIVVMGATATAPRAYAQDPIPRRARFQISQYLRRVSRADLIKDLTPPP